MSFLKTTSITDLFRRVQLCDKDNEAIPTSRKVEKNDGLGRTIKLDVEIKANMVMSSARPKKNDKEEENTGAFDVQALFGALLAAENEVPKKTGNVSKAKPAMKKTTKQDDDEDWVAESYDEDDEHSLAIESSQYDSKDEDELDWGLKASSSESSDDSCNDRRRLKDPFSPERAKGCFEYTISDSKNGSTQSIKRSARKYLSPPTTGRRLSLE